MLHHYLKTAFRNLVSNKVQTIIGVLGLAFGLACFAFGYQWLKYETSYDGFYPKSDRLYMLTGIENKTGKKIKEMPLPLLQVLKSDFPEIENATAHYIKYGIHLKEGDRDLGYPDLQHIDEYFFEYFVPHVICGRTDNLIRHKGDMVVNRSFAMKHWGSPEKALNSTLTDDISYTIVSVIEDFPKNSMFRTDDMWIYDILTRGSDQYHTSEMKWEQTDITIFFCLEEKVNVKNLNEKLKNYLVDNNYNDLTLEAIPITTVRHAMPEEYFTGTNAYNLGYIQMFTITTMVLLICVFLNFINMFINRVYQRVREIKLRHALGSGKRNLFILLSTDLFLQLVFVFFLFNCLIEVSFPYFSKIMEIETTPDSILIYNLICITGEIIVFLLCIPLFIFFIRSSALKVSGGLQAHHITLVRRAGMIFQVGICAAFIFCALGINKQVSFMMQKDLGFKKEGLIFIGMNSVNRGEIIREIEKMPQVLHLVPALFSYGHNTQTTNIVEWEGKSLDYKPNFQLIHTQSDFMATFRFQMSEGSFFDPEFDNIGISGMKYCVINKAAADIIGMDNIIGRKIKVWNYGSYQDGTHGMNEMEVLGVAKNFQTSSLNNQISPLIILQRGGRYTGYSYYIRVPDGKEAITVANINAIIHKHTMITDSESKVLSMDDVFNYLHKSEYASLYLFSFLALVCVLISLFGVYSISHSDMQRRRKEVAIRKVMGGSVNDILRMFIYEYFQIAVLSNILFIPFAWYIMNKWIQQFPYKGTIGFTEMVIVLILTTIFIILTVLGHILKVSSENPAEVVKSE